MYTKPCSARLSTRSELPLPLFRRAKLSSSIHLRTPDTFRPSGLFRPASPGCADRQQRERPASLFLNHRRELRSESPKRAPPGLSSQNSFDDVPFSFLLVLTRPLQNLRRDTLCTGSAITKDS